MTNFNNFLADYQSGNSAPTNAANSFAGETETAAHPTTNTTSVTEQTAVAPVELYGVPVVKYIEHLFPKGVPCGSRHNEALKLASDFIILLDGDAKKAKQALLELPWVRDIVGERGDKELDDIIVAAKARMKKKEEESLMAPQPSRRIREAIAEVTGTPYRLLTTNTQEQYTANTGGQNQGVNSTLERMARIIKRKFAPRYPLLPLVIFGLQLRQYVAAMFLGSAFAQNLMTRCWYRYFAAPGKKCRMNHILEVIGRMASGKHVAEDLHKIMMESVSRADQKQIDALNAYKLEKEQKSGAKAASRPKPQGMLRVLPTGSSYAAIRNCLANAKEIVDGEEMYLHLDNFDTELQNQLNQQKQVHFAQVFELIIKGFHNEDTGSLVVNNTAIVGKWPVTLNSEMTAQPQALMNQMANSYGTGLCTRITAIPIGDTAFEMMPYLEYTEENQHRDDELRRWSELFDKTKGEIPSRLLSKSLWNWTNQRIKEANEDQSLPTEDLCKRVGWHAMNFALPLIVCRHWDKMVLDETDGRYHCGPDFSLDKLDVELAIFIANVQLTFQHYYFHELGEQHYRSAQLSIGSQHKQPRSLQCYSMLPQVFTGKDVDKAYGYEGKKGSICSKLKRLQDDGYAERITKGADKGKFRKLL